MIYDTETTFAQIFDLGVSAANTLKTHFGYDVTEFLGVEMSSTDPEPLLQFHLFDDFQRNLTPDQRVDCGYRVQLSFTQAAGLSPTTWRSREQRELAIMARRLSSVGEDLDKIQSAQCQAFAKEILDRAESVHNLLEFNPNRVIN